MCEALGSKNKALTSGRPFEFQLGVGQVDTVCTWSNFCHLCTFNHNEQVIKGLDQEIAQMSKGEKSVLQIPAVLGYGSIGEFICDVLFHTKCIHVLLTNSIQQFE